MSATMPQEVLDVTTKFMREPIRILVKKEELTLEGIRQFYINVEREVVNLFELISDCISICLVSTSSFVKRIGSLRSDTCWPYLVSTPNLVYSRLSDLS